MIRTSIAMIVLACYPATFGWSQDTLPAGQPAQPAQQMSPEQFNQMVSYALGRSVAEDCQRGGVKLDLRALQTGVNEVQSGKAPQWSEQELGQVMRSFAMRIQRQIAENNKQQGEAFLAKNAKEPGVQVTPSGLQYKVLKQGSGATPTDDSMVICHYQGTFINGQVFDSSYQRGQPAQFPVQGVIDGWTEALKMMKEGAKYQLFVPANLAYGESGQDRIGPNETLLFEVELLKVVNDE